jgi:hypothetical protein
MKSIIYRLLGYYNIVMGALLAITILIIVGVMIFKVYMHHPASLNYSHLGIMLLIYLVLFSLCLVGVRSGVLLNREQSVAIRGAFVVMLPQLLTIATSKFTYIFHYGLFFDVGFLKKFYHAAIWSHWWSWQSRGGVMLGAPTVKGVVVPIQLAVYCNLTAFLCCFGLLYLWLSERKSARLLTT